MMTSVSWSTIEENLSVIKETFSTSLDLETLTAFKRKLLISVELKAASTLATSGIEVSWGDEMTSSWFWKITLSSSGFLEVETWGSFWEVEKTWVFSGFVDSSFLMTWVEKAEKKIKIKIKIFQKKLI
jgi:hypothetical protein